MKAFFKNVLLVSVPALVLIFIILEVFLSFLMPLPARPTTVFHEESGVLKFSPESGSGTYTKGRFFQLRADWTINNEGWNSVIDYHNDHNNNLTAIIGDSYVEALQVDSDESFHHLLRERLPEGRQVYAFGKSLYPFSHYLHMSRVVVERYNPDTIVFNLVHNDFPESINGTRDSRFKMLMQYTVGPDSSVSERPPFYPVEAERHLNPGAFRRFVGNIRIQRYIRHPEYLGIQIFNALAELFSAKTEGDAGADRFENNVDPDEVSQMDEQIIRSVDYTIGKIREENPDRRLVFVLDGPREHIYAGSDLSNSSVYWIHELMREVAAQHQVEFIDLGPLMEVDYAIHNTKFNSEIDWHWNEYGHRFVAGVLYDHLADTH